MADHYISLNRGTLGTKNASVTAGTSTSSDDLEIRIADAAGWTKHEIHVALLALDAHFLQGKLGTNFPIL